MKNKKEITWMHVEKMKEIPEEIKNLQQSEKWLHAMCKAPNWKKDEYAAQSIAWEEEGREYQNMYYWLNTLSEFSWCNPLARS